MPLRHRATVGCSRAAYHVPDPFQFAFRVRRRYTRTMPSEERPMNSRVLRELGSQHARIREDMQRLQDMRDELDAELRALEAIAAALPNVPAETATNNGHDPGERSDDVPASRMPATNKRPLIGRLIAERPTPGWTPREVLSALVERGDVDPKTTINAIRVTLKRMVDRNELVKDEQDRYTVPVRVRDGQEVAF